MFILLIQILKSNNRLFRELKLKTRKLFIVLFKMWISNLLICMSLFTFCNSHTFLHTQFFMTAKPNIPTSDIFTPFSLAAAVRASCALTT